MLPALSVFSRADCLIAGFNLIKKCCSCNHLKLGQEFHNNKSSKDGKQGKCIKCTNIYSSQYRKDNRDSLHEKRNYNCKKYKAQQQVRNAVKRGDLIKPKECEECNNQGDVIGHHDDYNKPLNVRWICKPCHGLWHMKNGEAKNAK